MVIVQVTDTEQHEQADATGFTIEHGGTLVLYRYDSALRADRLRAYAPGHWIGARLRS